MDEVQLYVLDQVQGYCHVYNWNAYRAVFL